MTLDRLFAGPIAGATTTQNLYPFNAGAQLGFGSNTAQNGFYAEGHFKSTFTQVIQPTLDNDGFSNIVRINGIVSTQQITTSTITANNILIRGANSNLNYLSTYLVKTSYLGAADFGPVITGSLYPLTSNNTQLGYGPTGLGTWWRAWFSNVYVGAYKPLSTDINSTINLEYHVVASTLTVSTINTTNISSFFYGGIEKYDYVSSVALQSSIVGLGTFGYISTQQLQSTTRGLGNIYLSTFTGSTTFLSSAVGSISSLAVNSLTVNSLTIGSGGGWVDFGAIRAVIVSSIQTNTSLLYASSITGDGSQIYNLPAISTASLQSTIVGLGTFGYISSSQLISTTIGLVDHLELNSTVRGLGTLGYLSSTQLFSTTAGLGNIGYISSSQLISTTIGLVDHLELNSTVTGLGNVGYISSTQLFSTVAGLISTPKTFIIQTFTF
jgi:hypothetical protein